MRASIIHETVGVVWPYTWTLLDTEGVVGAPHATSRAGVIVALHSRYRALSLFPNNAPSDNNMLRLVLLFVVAGESFLLTPANFSKITSSSVFVIHIIIHFQGPDFDDLKIL